ncbi:hypothetical protein KSP39_PZI015713 [Platanthera zijinensis]|uniref:Uncharacterized protein n=1 Tax=Platanthera zijinensis TaxID=2320716 RepID=A0AAP0B9Z4_9ASPA
MRAGAPARTDLPAKRAPWATRVCVSPGPLAAFFLVRLALCRRSPAAALLPIKAGRSSFGSKRAAIWPPILPRRPRLEATLPSPRPVDLPLAAGRIPPVKPDLRRQAIFPVAAAFAIMCILRRLISLLRSSVTWIAKEKGILTVVFAGSRFCLLRFFLLPLKRIVILLLLRFLFYAAICGRRSKRSRRRSRAPLLRTARFSDRKIFVRISTDRCPGSGSTLVSRRSFPVLIKTRKAGKYFHRQETLFPACLFFDLEEGFWHVRSTLISFHQLDLDLRSRSSLLPLSRGGGTTAPCSSSKTDQAIFYTWQIRSGVILRFPTGDLGLFLLGKSDQVILFSTKKKGEEEFHSRSTIFFSADL